jgi:hypothetical protein
MPAVRTYITGLDDALKCFDQAPKNLLKVVKTAMKDGGKQAAKEFRKVMPRRFKRLITNKVVKGSVSGDYSALIGAFNRVKSGTDEPDDWFKAYWKNYGTLTKRDKDHTFDYPVKKLGRPRRNEVGQDAEHFYDRAVAPAQQTFIRAFQESLKAQEDKLKER